jgi:hypothetical protein
MIAKPVCNPAGLAFGPLSTGGFFKPPRSPGHGRFKEAIPVPK